MEFFFLNLLKICGKADFENQAPNTVNKLTKVRPISFCKKSVLLKKVHLSMLLLQFFFAFPQNLTQKQYCYCFWVKF